MNKKDIYNAMVKNFTPYTGSIYLVCCIGVEYDYDIVPHFIRYYKELGVDEFIFVLNTNIPNSEKLAEVQQVLRCHGIEEKMVWMGDFSSFKQIEIFTKITEEYTDIENWIITADVDEFQEYPCDLRKLISFLDDAEYNFISGSLIDRLSVDGSLTTISEETNLFETFPIQSCIKNKLIGFGIINKILLHKQYIKLTRGQHNVVYDENDMRKYRKYPGSLSVYHFKWRGLLLTNQKDRIEMNNRSKTNKIGFYGIKYRQETLNYYREHGSFI